MAAREVLSPAAAAVRVCGDDGGAAVVGVSWRSILARAVALCVIRSAAFWSRDGPGVGFAGLSMMSEIRHWAGCWPVVPEGKAQSCIEITSSCRPTLGADGEACLDKFASVLVHSSDEASGCYAVPPRCCNTPWRALREGVSSHGIEIAEVLQSDSPLPSAHTFPPASAASLSLTSVTGKTTEAHRPTEPTKSHI